MIVAVTLHTILQRQTPQGLVSQLEVDMPPNSSLADLLDTLEIDLDPEAILLVVNKRVATPDRLLNEGDHVNLMPALSGG